MHRRSLSDLEAVLDHIRRSPADVGTVELLVRRPRVDVREVLDAGHLDVDAGLVGDNWRERYDGEPDLDAQLTLMNARLADLIAGGRDRWPLAGDQLYVDLDLSTANLPPRTRLQLGSALVEITSKPHRGCAKFAGRFGADALRFVNLGPGRDLRLRGVYARVLEPGVVRPGDPIRTL